MSAKTRTMAPEVPFSFQTHLTKISLIVVNNMNSVIKWIKVTTALRKYVWGKKGQIHLHSTVQEQIMQDQPASVITIACAGWAADKELGRGTHREMGGVTW